jgi:hypothetical protein
MSLEDIPKKISRISVSILQRWILEKSWNTVGCEECEKTSPRLGTFGILYSLRSLDVATPRKINAIYTFQECCASIIISFEPVELWK